MVVVVVGLVSGPAGFGAPGGTGAPLAVEEVVEGDASLAFAGRTALWVGQAAHRGVGRLRVLLRSHGRVLILDRRYQWGPLRLRQTLGQTKNLSQARGRRSHRC